MGTLNKDGVSLAGSCFGNKCVEARSLHLSPRRTSVALITVDSLSQLLPEKTGEEEEGQIGPGGRPR